VPDLGPSARLPCRLAGSIRSAAAPAYGPTKTRRHSAAPILWAPSRPLPAR